MNAFSQLDRSIDEAGYVLAVAQLTSSKGLSILRQKCEG